MIRHFRGDNFFLSNFFQRPVTYQGITYQNNEAAFQAMKTLDENARKTFATLGPSEAKKMGRRIALRPDWEDVKYGIMYDIVKAKFTQNNDLGNKLLATGDEELVEDTTSWHDNIWGDCTCPKCKNIVGKNYLGNILMTVRKELRDDI